MRKCDKCNKQITKAKPGVECNRCEKIVHITTECSGLTSKQQSAIRAAENLEWTCKECHKDSPKRRSIVFPGDEEDDDEGNSANIDIKQLLKDISKEMEKTLKRELKDINESLQYHSDKMDEVLLSLASCEETIKDLKKKNTELANKNNNLETRVGALEQHLREMEQRQLCKHIEVHNVPITEDEDALKIAGHLATTLKVKHGDVEQAKRLPGKRDRPGPIQIQLKDEGKQNEWLTAYKTNKATMITVADLIPGAPAPTAHNAVYINESLTPYNKHLLWFAKQELKSKYKFVWVKKGVIRARKEGQEEKFLIIRSTEDVKKLSA